jgi:hypothetical protein
VAISKPVAVYNAENNVEAQLLCNYFDQNDIEAYPTKGINTFGDLPEVFKTQVWVDVSNVAVAKLLLVEYEREREQRTMRKEAQAAETGSIDVVCEECGKSTSFAASMKGTVQDCSHCAAFVDVGEDESFDWPDS